MIRFLSLRTRRLVTHSRLPPHSPGCCRNPTLPQLLEDVRALKRNGLASDAATLAQRLRELGYSCSARRQEGSHAGQGTMRLAHEFVVVEGPSLPEPLVVEPFFRDHFTIGRAFTTDRYATVLAAAPEELVATYRQLADLVKLLCQEMQFSFEANGNFLPPWRSTRTVLSRWSPARAA